MTSRLMVLSSIFLLILACSSKYRSVPSGIVFFAYEAGAHGVASLPFRFESVEFISEGGKVHRIYLGDKTLDMALTESSFIKAVTVPAQSFSRVRWTISMKDSELHKYSPREQRWLSVQMIDAEQQYVPQTRETFIVESLLTEPLIISSDTNHFFLIDMHAEKSLSLANTQTAERYMLFDPRVSMKPVSSMSIHGELVSVDKNGGVRLIVSGISVAVKAKKWFYQGEAIQNLDQIHTLTPRRAYITAELPLMADEVMQADIDVVDGAYHRGFVFQPDVGVPPVFKGHLFDPERGYIYQSKIAFPEQIKNIYSGQRIAFYRHFGSVLAEKNIRILASEIYVKVLDSHAEKFEVMSVNHFERGTFYQGHVNVIATLIEFNEPVEAVLQLQGFFSENGFYAKTIDTADESADLTLNLYRFNDLMIFHDTDERDMTRLFFLKSLADAEGGVSLYGGAEPTPEPINQIQLIPASILSLAIRRDKTMEHLTFPTFKALKYALMTELKQYKITRLLGRGRTRNESMLLDEFMITLGYGNLGAERSLTDADSLIDFGLMNDDSKKQIEMHKDDIERKNKDVRAYAEIARRLKEHEIPSSTRAKIEVDVIGRSHLENQKEQDGISLTYNKDSYSILFEEEGSKDKRKRMLLHASFNDDNNKKFLADNPLLMDLLSQRLSGDVEPLSEGDNKTIIQFNNARLLVNAETLEVIPLTFNPETNSFEALESIGVAQEVSAHNYNETRFTIKKTKVGDQLLYTVEIDDESLKQASHNGEQKNTVILLTGDDEGKIKNSIQELIDSTPANKRQQIYYGTKSGDYLHTLLDDHAVTPHKALVSHVKSGYWNYYRLDLAEIRVIGEGTEATKFHYMPDSAIALADKVNRSIGTIGFLNILGFDELTGHEERLNELNAGRVDKNPSELRVLIQLENDERVINPDIYKTFQRYPEHTIIVQMNNHGDFSIVNGVGNIEKFTQPKYKSHVIYHLHGHGNLFYQGTKTPETLAKIIHDFERDAPEVIAERFNENYSDRQVSVSDISMLPSHFVMDGCSLGKRGKWFVNTLTEDFSSDYVRYESNERQAVTIRADGLEKKQMIFSGESFTGKFIYSYDISGSSDAIEDSRVIFYESWSKTSVIDELGESRVSDVKNLLEDTKKHHLVYKAGSEGFAERVEGIEYRQNRSGFIEYKLPVQLDAQQSYRKVFRGPLPPVIH